MSTVMRLGRKQHNVVSAAIERWREAGVIDAATAGRLAGSMERAGFDWQRAARYAFLLSIFSLLITLGALLADRALVALLLRLFDAPAIVKCGALAALAAGFFAAALQRRRRAPQRVYGNEFLFFLGVLAVAGAVFFLGVAIDTGSGRFSVLFLIASLVYAALGLRFPSALVWVFGLAALGTWMGTETGYVSGWGAYYLGMNYPLRFVFFGAALLALGIGAAPLLRGLGQPTRVMGLLYLFIALWIMSIFGNYGDLGAWQRAKQTELFHWALVFGAAGIAALWYGLRHDDGTFRGFGLTFLGINLYTRLFEYFWDSLHKAAFFAILAGSFWLIGTRAESLCTALARKVRPLPADQGG